MFHFHYNYPENNCLFNYLLVCSCNTNGTILPEICEMVIGYCFCKENITGKDCTECKAGFYGDPTQNIECLPCPCLSVENPICHLIDDGTAVCDNCGPAYTGTFCEFCSNGYYRDEEVKHDAHTHTHTYTHTHTAFTKRHKDMDIRTLII